jgi:glutamate-ammonia-ligase adenylyltransferase
VTGSQDLGIETMELVHNFIYGPWDTAMPGYARNVRTRMEREIAKEATGERLHLKVGKGGLADIDFLLQLVQIREGTGRSEFRLAGTREMLSSLPDNRYIGAPEADQLREAYDLLRTLETVLRIESDTGRGWIPTAPSALESIAPRVGVVPSTGEALLQRYREVTGGVREIFEAGMSRLEAPGS